jgi:pSer/pThr/pTyr-binding forkhead associated (FHA) protein
VILESTAAQPGVSLGYLIVDDEIIYELAPNSVLNIGRLDTNDIILDDYKVSREHAILKYSSGEFTLIDLASTHGTFVNGEGVEKQPLPLGSVIQIVNHELLITDKIPDELRENQVLPTPRTARSMDRRLKFFGGLNEFSLLTLVQFLSQEKQTGLLLIEMGQNPGPRLYFLEGEIIHVTDDEGLGDLLTRQYHEQSLFFYFHHETSFPERTIHQSTPSFLMELCQKQDQQQSLEEVNAAAAERMARTLAVTSRLVKPRDQQ